MTERLFVFKHEGKIVLTVQQTYDEMQIVELKQEFALLSQLEKVLII